MITGWGANSQYHQVHWFLEETGLPACGGKRRKSKATLPLPHWDPKNEMTCRICRDKMLPKIQAQQQDTAQISQNAQTARN